MATMILRDAVLWARHVAGDPYLLALSASLTEWNGPEDGAAHDGR